jgi:hypothetical protein
VVNDLFASPGLDRHQIELQLLALYLGYNHLLTTLSCSGCNTGKKFARWDCSTRRLSFWHAFSFHRISFEFSLIVFCLKSLSPSGVSVALFLQP